MALSQELKDLGVDTDAGVERMAGNTALYEKLLGSLKDLIQKSSDQMDFDKNDNESLIEAAHSIKGASGNLAVTPIYEAYTEIVDLLRKQQPEEAKKAYEKILPLQTAIIECIEKNS